MKRAAIVLMLVVLAACQQSAQKAEPPAELTSYERTARVKLLWERIESNQPKHDLNRLRPSIQDGIVYTADSVGDLAAYELRTGKRIWSAHLRRTLSSGVAVAGERLFVATQDNQLLTLKSADGQLLWALDMPSEVLNIPVGFADRVVVRTLDGRVLMLDAETGTQLWAYRINVPALSLRGSSEPLVSAEAVYVGLDNGRFVALSFDSGTVIWEQVIGTPTGRSEVERLVDVDSSPIADGGEIYVASYQGRVMRISRSDGTSVWTRELSTFQPLALDERRVFVTDADSVVWALDRRNGTALWSQDQLQRRRLTGVTTHDEFLALGDYQGYIHWLSRFDGRLAVRKRVDSKPISSAPVNEESVLLVQGRGGSIAALQISPLE